MIQKHKICLLGEYGVGKTTLQSHYIHENKDQYSQQTFRMNYVTKTIISSSSIQVEINIWDTADSERFRSMTSNYFRRASAFLIMYDITNKESFEDVIGWHVQIDNECDITDTIVVIVGNKCDLESQRVISTAEGQQIAKQLNCLFFECVATERESVDKLILTVVDEIINRNIPGLNRIESSDQTGINGNDVDSNIGFVQDTDIVDIGTNNTDTPTDIENNSNEQACC